MAEEAYIIAVDERCQLLSSSIDTPDEFFEPGYYLSFRDDVEEWIADNLSADVEIDTNFDNDAYIFLLVFESGEDLLAFQIKWMS